MAGVHTRGAPLVHPMLDHLVPTWGSFPQGTSHQLLASHP